MQGKQKPRELSNRYGYTALSTTELLALIFRHGTKSRSVFDLSKQIGPVLESRLQSRSTLSEFKQEVQSHHKLGPIHQHTLFALYELLSRQQSKPPLTPMFTSPKKLAERFHHLAHKKQEYVYGVYLSPRLAIVHTELLTKGTTDAVSIDIRDVLYFGIKYRVRHIVLVHNHPTGVPTPSNEDTEITRRIVAAANLLSMTLLDHIIVAQEGYFSFKESSNVL